MSIIKLNEEQRQLFNEVELISVRQAYTEIMAQKTSYNITAQAMITVNGKLFKKNTSSVSALRLNKLVADQAEIDGVESAIRDEKPHYPRHWVIKTVKSVLNKELGLDF